MHRKYFLERRLNKNFTVIDVCGHEFSTSQKEKVRKQEVYICDCIHAIQGQCQERVSEKDPLDSLQEPTFLKDDTTQGPESSKHNASLISQVVSKEVKIFAGRKAAVV